MPVYLLDTNILLRITRRDDPEHGIVEAALEELLTANTTLCYTHQNIAEFWNVFTRPVDKNGFGLSVAAAEIEIQRIESMMVLLPDTEAVYRKWRQLILRYQVTGVKVHDARIISCMLVHGISSLLTLNVADFGRYAELVKLVHPRNIAISKDARGD